MGIKKRREYEKNSMRTLILEAATNIINTQGYDKLSMRKIALAIDYSPTTIYIYYKHKAEIVADISTQLYKKIVFNIEHSLVKDTNIPVDEQLELTFNIFINTLTTYPEMGSAVIRSGTNAIFGPDESEVEGHKGISLLQALLQKGQEQNIFSKLDDNVSWMIITALLGFSMNAIENKRYLNENWSDLVDTYTKILINGLRARKDNLS